MKSKPSSSVVACPRGAPERERAGAALRAREAGRRPGRNETDEHEHEQHAAGEHDELEAADLQAPRPGGARRQDLDLQPVARGGRLDSR